jgi:hypothetical protein
MNWSRIAPATAASVLLLAGAWRISADGGEGWPLLLLGAVIVGVAIVLHVQDRNG